MDSPSRFGIFIAKIANIGNPYFTIHNMDRYTLVKLKNMDSKNIYIGCMALMRKAQWERLKDDSEWKFVDVGKEFQSAEVQRRINDFFSNSRIFFVINRHNSKEIAKETAAEEVKNALQENTITLCEKDLRKFMMFHYIGIARQGTFGS